MAATTQTKALKDVFGNLLLGPTGVGQLAATPTPAATPVDAAVGGTNPDAAKMAGTPAQTSAPTALPRTPAPEAPQATRLDEPQGAQLRDVIRAEASQPQGMTEQQAQKVVKAQQMQRLFGDMGSRIQSLISTAIPAVLPAAQPGAGTPLTAAAASLTPEQRAAVEAMAKAPSVQTIAAAKQALGGADPTQYLQGADSASVAGQITAGTPAFIKQMGYNLDEVAEALGVNAAALGSMTVEQLQEQINSKIQGELQTVDSLRAQLDDPALGPNERAQLRQQLAQMGASGVYSSEQEMDTLAQRVAGADTIEFNGAMYTVDELLGDETITGLVTKYLDDPKFAAELRAKEPQFAKFVDSHANALKDAVIHASEAGAQFDEIQKGNATLLSTLSGAGLTSAAALLEAIAPGSTTGVATSGINMKHYPVLAMLTDPAQHAAAAKAGVDPRALVANLEALVQVDPEMARNLAHMNLGQLKKIGAGSTEGFKAYLTWAQEETEFSKLDPEDTAGMIHFLFGSGATPRDAMSILKSELKRHTGYGAKLAYMIDRDRDGRMDSPLEIHKRLQEDLSKFRLPTLAGITGPGNSVSAIRIGPDSNPTQTEKMIAEGKAAAEKSKRERGTLEAQRMREHPDYKLVMKNHMPELEWIRSNIGSKGAEDRAVAMSKDLYERRQKYKPGTPAYEAFSELMRQYTALIGR